MNKILFILFFITCLLSDPAFADDCTISSGLLRGGTVSPANSTSDTHVYTASMMTHASIVSCLTRTNNNTTGAILNSSLSLTGSNIDTSSSVSNNGLTYYKLTNTGNEFIDNYGYIYFTVSDNNSANTPSITLPSMVSNGGTWNIYSNSYNRVTQGLRFTPTFYFSKVPTSTITQTLIFGTYNVNVTYGFNTYYNSPLIYSSVVLTPVATNTCSVQNTTVTLPTTNISSLASSGSESGRTAFTISATCSSGLASTAMTGVMLDANNVNNSSYYLTNTGTATDISVKMYDSSNVAIPLGGNGDSFSFGTTTAGTTPTISKRFYAVYRRNGSTTLSAGTIKAQATISLFYN